MYVYSWFIVLTESLLTVRLAVSEIKPVQSLTDGQTDKPRGPPLPKRAYEISNLPKDFKISAKISDFS